MDYYKDEYMVRTKQVNGEEKYYLKFLGSVGVMSEVEVDFDTYTLYAKEFSKPLKRHKYFKATYCENKNIEDVLDTDNSALKTPSAEQMYADRERQEEIMSIVKGCTSIQQRRWNLRLQGLTLEEIARIEKCSHVAVIKSISAVAQKIKKRFC